jgi:crossover junction endodeoxyribonuclease RusA
MDNIYVSSLIWYNSLIETYTKREEGKRVAKQEVTDLVRVQPTSTNRTLSMKLPVPPSVNHLHYNTRGGGKRLTAKAQHYIRDSRALINLAIEEQRWEKAKKGVWLYVDLVFYFPDRRIRDSHNCLKILLDVMQGIVYENDYTVLPRIQSVEYDKDDPRVELRVLPQTKNNRSKGLKTTQVVV